MDVITIPKKLAKNDDLVIIPRKKYEEFLEFFSSNNHDGEEKDADLSIKIYKQEKRKNKLKVIKSLTELR